MARIDEVKLDTEDAKVIREHHFFALDLTREQEANHSLRTKIEELLEKAEDNGEITGYYFDHNFDEDITSEYDKA